MTRDDGYTRYTVRIPTQLYERVKEAAGEKSVNAEIVERLFDSLDNDRKPFDSMSEEINSLNKEITLLEKEIGQQNDKIKSLVIGNMSLKIITDKNHEFQKRLMLNVLNFADEIPFELAVWAYDMIQVFDRDESISERVASEIITEEEALQRIREKRENYQQEAMNAIRDYARNHGTEPFFDQPDETAPD